MPAASEKLRGVKNFSSLVGYLRNELHWPIETDNWDDLTFEYDPEDLGLQKEYGGAIQKLWQLRPLDSRQPWGIFFVEFKKKKLPIIPREILPNFHSLLFYHKHLVYNMFYLLKTMTQL